MEEKSRKPSRCIECHETIAGQAKKCRHCGAYQRKSARWTGGLITVLSLLLALLTTFISSRDQIADIINPKTPLFAAIEDVDDQFFLKIHNQSDESVVLENMMCFVKLTEDQTDDRYLDSHWSGDQSSLIAPGEIFQTEISLGGSGVIEGHTDDKVGEPLPFEIVTRRRMTSGCACDPNGPYEPTYTEPGTMCRLYYRSSRNASSFYDFSADSTVYALNRIRQQELDDVQATEETNLRPDGSDK